MTRTSVSEVLARANAAMVAADLDVTGALARLLSGVTASLPASAAAVLVDTDGSLEVLAATSHRALDLEMHQAQADEGPCLDALRTGVEVHAVGADDLVARWPQAGPAIVASGYRAVQALPLAWHPLARRGAGLRRAGRPGRRGGVTLGVAARRVLDRARTGTLDARPAGS